MESFAVVLSGNDEFYLPFDMLDIKKDTVKGRCFIAKQEIPVGNRVLKAEPFGIIVDQGSIENVCANCVREPTCILKLTITCPQACRKVYYCSKECQSNDWEMFHRHECGFQHESTFSDYATDYLRLLMRMLIKWYKNPEHKDIKHIQSLCHNIESFKDSQINEFYGVAKELRKFIQEKLEDFIFPNVDVKIRNVIDSRISLDNNLYFLFLLIAQEECNSFGLYTFNYEGRDSPRQGFGLALYPQAVYFNHSCRPNVGHSYSSDQSMEFFSLDAIASGQEAMISYIELITNRNDRMKKLFEIFHFNCQCNLCTVPKQRNHDLVSGCKNVELLKCPLDCGV
jgi:hypothetical protein